MFRRAKKRLRSPGTVKFVTPEELRSRVAEKSVLLNEPWQAWTAGRLLFARCDLKTRLYPVLSSGARGGELVELQSWELSLPNPSVVAVPKGGPALFLGEHRAKAQSREAAAPVSVRYHFLTQAGHYFASPSLFRDEEEGDDLPKDE